MDSNICLYDWLSFTSKTLSADDIKEALCLSLDFSFIKGAHGYRDRYYSNGISIHFNGRDDMGVWCEMSGQGCRAFESFSNLSWESLFKFIANNQCKITRLDVAYDDHTGVLDIDDLLSDTLSGNFVSRSTYWESIISSAGKTLQFGSPKSKILIRIYDKAAERGFDDSVHWVRVELQLRDGRASEFLKIPLSLGDAFSGVLLNYLRFVVPSDDSNKWRWAMADYWVDLLSFLTRISVFTSPGVDYNLAKVNDYVFNQAGNAIDCAIRVYGLTGFQILLRDREVRPNPKYDIVVKQARFADLCSRVRAEFGLEAVS